MVSTKDESTGVNACSILELERKARFIISAKFSAFLKKIFALCRKQNLIKANKIKTKWVSGKGERETNQNCGYFLRIPSKNSVKSFSFGK